MPSNEKIGRFFLCTECVSADIFFCKNLCKYQYMNVNLPAMSKRFALKNTWPWYLLEYKEYTVYCIYIVYINIYIYFLYLIIIVFFSTILHKFSFLKIKKYVFYIMS